MKEILCNSAYFGVTVSLIGYGAGIMLKKKFKYAFLNPLLISIIFVIGVVMLCGVDYESYENSAQYLSYLLTPATVRVLDVNLKGAFFCMKLAARLMSKQRYGRIINMSSVVGLRGNAGQVNYAASKAGLIGMTKSLAKEIASRGVTVNAIAPGFIETDMTRTLLPTVQDSILTSIPLKRFGQPEEVAHAAAFLASEEAGYITGQVLCIDGGMAM